MATRILHLSDTHLTASGFDEDGIPAIESLDRMLHDCRHLGGLDVVIVTGDLADDGSAAGCQIARDRIGAFAAERGIPTVYTTGNHDTRPAFTEVFGSGHLDSTGRGHGRPLVDTAERAAVSHVGGLRVISLDSLIPGHGHGELSRAQLDALTSELQHPSPEGTVLAFHHPPITIGTAPWSGPMGLHNATELEAAIVGSDVRAILCGHFHLQLTTPLGEATVWVTPGVPSRIDLTAPPNRARIVRGAGASVIELPDAGPPTCYTLHARDPEAGREVLVYDFAAGAASTES